MSALKMYYLESDSRMKEKMFITREHWKKFMTADIFYPHIVTQWKLVQYKFYIPHSKLNHHYELNTLWVDLLC